MPNGPNQCHFVPGGCRARKELATLRRLARPTDSSIVRIGTPKSARNSR